MAGTETVHSADSVWNVWIRQAIPVQAPAARSAMLHTRSSKAWLSAAVAAIAVLSAPLIPQVRLASAEGLRLHGTCMAMEGAEAAADVDAVTETPEQAPLSPAVALRSLAELAREAEQKCLEQSADPPSPEMIIAAVEAACLILKEEGMAAHRLFRGGESPFIFGGTYIWIHDLTGTMLLHPIKPEMEGLNLLGLRDVRGKRLFAEMNDAVIESGSAWVTYHWPRPGEEDPSSKSSYVRLCEVDGRPVVIGCGINEGTASFH